MLFTGHARAAAGRIDGKSPRVVDFIRAQQLGKVGMSQEWSDLREATKIVTNVSSEVVLGILADTGVSGIDTLRNWVCGLQLPRGTLTAYDELGSEVNIKDMAQEPVFIKYNSSANGDAYMKESRSEFVGVLFQPKLAFNPTTFYQFGYAPLELFS